MAKSRVSYGWVIVIVATLALVISNGLSIGGLPPFYKPTRKRSHLMARTSRLRWGFFWCE